MRPSSTSGSSTRHATAQRSFASGPRDEPAPPGGGVLALQQLADRRNKLGMRLWASERAAPIWSGPGGGGGARLAELAHELGFADKPGCGAFHLPATPNGHGVAAAVLRRRRGRGEPEPIGLLVVSGDDAAADPSVRALAEQAEAVIAITMYQGLATGWPTSSCRRPATWSATDRRQPRGPAAAAAPRGPSAGAGRAGLAVPAGRLRARALAASVGGVRAGGRTTLPRPRLQSARRARPTPAAHGVRAAPAGAEPRGPVERTVGEHFVGELRLRATGRCSQACTSNASRSSVPAPRARDRASPADAERRSIAAGDHVFVRANGTSVEPAHASTAASPQASTNRRRARKRPAPAGRGGGRDDALAATGDAGSPWWIAAIEALVIVNLVLFTFAYLTLAERKVMGRMQLRYGPIGSARTG